MTTEASERASSAQWQTLGAVSPVRLQEAGHYLRYALQWVERGARCCLESERDKSEDESEGAEQGSVVWDVERDGLFSPALGQRKYEGKYLGLRFSEGVPRLVFGEDSVFELDGRTDAEARQWARECVESLSFSASSFNDPVLLPPHPLAEGARYKLAEHRASLSELSLWFGNAALSLEGLRQGVEAVCCSSAAFTLSLRHQRQGMKQGGGKSNAQDRGGRGVVGFCGGDMVYPQPYFYVVADPAWDNEPAWEGEGARGFGIFHRGGFSGFVVLGEQVVTLAEQESMVALFLQEAMEVRSE